MSELPKCDFCGANSLLAGIEGKVVCSVRCEKSIIHQLEAERDEARTVLSAWHSQFKTTQLTHAICNRDSQAKRITAPWQAFDEL